MHVECSAQYSSKIKALDKWQLSHTRSAYYVPGTMQSSGDTTVNQTEPTFCVLGWGGQEGLARASSTPCESLGKRQQGGPEASSSALGPDSPAEALSVRPPAHRRQAQGPQLGFTCARATGPEAVGLGASFSPVSQPQPSLGGRQQAPQSVPLSISFSVGLTELSVSDIL